MAVHIQQGDLQARDELVQANLRFVVDVAKHFQNRGLPLCELISAGNLGLLTAAERFDGAKGFKFISYAVWWIRQSILQTIAEQVRTVRLPGNRLNLLKDIAKVSRRLGQSREHEPDVEEIAAELEVSVATVRDTLLSGRAVYSLDKVIELEEGDLNGLLNYLADPWQESPDAEVLRASARKQLTGVLNGLDEREKRILRLYFGLDGEEVLTLAQIGADLGITRERVRQLKERAFSKLRHPTRYPALRALAGAVTPAG
ncbi:MAG: RNA polymerase sigma factor RpoD/SigA [Candidatus Latescibacteria bacterium]|nr:RNA polymerase sigma factor RpoD/SigA [Candidatus Latescibacterota bacterium]